MKDSSGLLMIHGTVKVYCHRDSPACKTGMQATTPQQLTAHHRYMMQRQDKTQVKDAELKVLWNQMVS